MKKLSAIILTAVLLISLALPAFAQVEGKSQYPIITLHGDGNEIFDENGKQVYDFDYDTSNLASDVVEVCMPNLISGIITGDYSAYYEALYNKLSDIYGDAKLDKNGNPTAGTGISQRDIDYMTSAKNTDTASQKGYYNMGEYAFWYDWRLDPMIIADELDEYINAILATTGKAKVSIYGRCLGGTPIIAYLQKYGSAKLDTVCLDSIVGNGCERIGDMFTGKLNFNSDALMRFANGDASEDIKEITGNLLFDIIVSTLRTLNSLGLSEKAISAIMDDFYDTFAKGVVASFVRAGYATWISYWSAVKQDEYDEAISFVFGEKGSALREEYTGLIEKIDYYHYNVTAKLPEILTNVKNSGTKVCIISKYGFQLFPYLNTYDKISDRWVSVDNTSFNAATAKIGTVFSDEYIKAKNEAGLGKYISVDKEIDASTCILPECTWFIKGISHDNWADCMEELAYTVCSSNGQFTVNSSEKYPQFLKFDKPTSSLVPLTEENMNCEDYYGVDTGSTENLTTIERFIKILKELVDLLKILLSTFFGSITAPTAG